MWTVFSVERFPFHVWFCGVFHPWCSISIFTPSSGFCCTFTSVRGWCLVCPAAVRTWGILYPPDPPRTLTIVSLTSVHLLLLSRFTRLLKVLPFWHVYVLGPVYFMWPWKSHAPHVTSRTECNIDVTPGTLTATDTCIGYHVTRFQASLNVILHTSYVSTCVGAVCGRGRGTKINITDTHTNNTCDKYKSSLRHIHNPVLSSLKMKGIRLLFFTSPVGSWVFFCC
jgi:hypothetical protein